MVFTSKENLQVIEEIDSNSSQQLTKSKCILYAKRAAIAAGILTLSYVALMFIAGIAIGYKIVGDDPGRI